MPFQVAEFYRHSEVFRSRGGDTAAVGSNSYLIMWIKKSPDELQKATSTIARKKSAYSKQNFKAFIFFLAFTFPGFVLFWVLFQMAPISDSQPPKSWEQVRNDLPIVLLFAFCLALFFSFCVAFSKERKTFFAFGMVLGEEEKTNKICTSCHELILDAKTTQCEQCGGVLESSNLWKWVDAT